MRMMYRSICRMNDMSDAFDGRMSGSRHADIRCILACEAGIESNQSSRVRESWTLLYPPRGFARSDLSGVVALMVFAHPVQRRDGALVRSTATSGRPMSFSPPV